MRKYREKPRVVRAFRWEGFNGSNTEVEKAMIHTHLPADEVGTIRVGMNPEDWEFVNPGDWVVLDEGEGGGVDVMDDAHFRQCYAELLELVDEPPPGEELPPEGPDDPEPPVEGPDDPEPPADL